MIIFAPGFDLFLCPYSFNCQSMNQKYFYRDLKIGILGGGQLGRMLLQAAIDLNLNIHILDPDSHAPCSALTRNFQVGSLTDYDTVYRFGEDLDLITIEIENVNVDALEALEKEGKTICPKPAVIRMIQDKCTQKQWFSQHKIPSAPYTITHTREEVVKQVNRFPLVQKLGKGGYDGRGVHILRTIGDLAKAFDEPSVLEECVEIEKEIAVLAARNAKGEVSVFPTVEMVFHPTANLVEYLFSPSDISQETEKEVVKIATDIVNKLDYTGLIAVEMFLDKNGRILVNELAPRPHNSGHHTIRSTATSQYEQHLRAILNLPLGSTQLLHPAAMLNLLGAEGYSGSVIYEGVEKALAIEGVFPHFYGKSITKPFRKMGHVTILEDNKQKLIEKVKSVQNILKVIS